MNRFFTARYSYQLIAALIVLIAVASQLLLLHSPQIGVYANTVFLATCLVAGLIKQKVRNIMLAISILPLATLVSVSWPQSHIFAQLVVFYDVLLLLGLTYYYLFRVRTMSAPAPKQGWLAQVQNMSFMIVLGQLLGLASFKIMGEQYRFDGDISLPLILVCSAVFDFAEELLFRGLIQREASKLMRQWPAIVATAGLFTAYSIGVLGFRAAAFGFAYSLLAGYVYARQSSIWAVTVLNVTTKLTFLGLVAAFIL